VKERSDGEHGRKNDKTQRRKGGGAESRDLVGSEENSSERREKKKRRIDFFAGEEKPFRRGAGALGLLREERTFKKREGERILGKMGWPTLGGQIRNSSDKPPQEERRSPENL